MSHPAMHVPPISGVGTATGKAIVLGEHLVVHGAAALALPISTLVETVIAQQVKSHDRVATSAARLCGPGIRALIWGFVELFGLPAAVASDVVLLASGAFPYGRGLGSSAALARAAVNALADLFKQQPTAMQIYELVQSMERTTHGSPSGVDAAATGAAGPIVFRRGAVRPVHPAPVGVFVVADSGEVSATKDSVTKVAEVLASQSEALTRRNVLVEQIDTLVAYAVSHMEHGNLGALGWAMNENHKVLRGLNLSTPGLERLVAAANSVGALGAKLTGSGRGGCVLALARDRVDADVISKAMVRAGAVATWSVALDSFTSELPVRSYRRDIAQ